MTLLPQDLHDRLIAFRSARDWEQFHSPQNLAIAIAVEAGELLEHFQWMRRDDARPAADALDALGLEVADLLILLSYFCNDLGIEPIAVVEKKLELNAKRYTVEKSRGNATKHDRL
jgi:NTP pyrophosphatase (non-canonical NTP hydrolase)